MNRVAVSAIALAGLAALASCDSSREEYCSSWGYQPGTPSYDRCLKHLQHRGKAQGKEAGQRFERTQIHPEW